MVFIISGNFHRVALGIKGHPSPKCILGVSEPDVLRRRHRSKVEDNSILAAGGTMRCTFPVWGDILCSPLPLVRVVTSS